MIPDIRFYLSLFFRRIHYFLLLVVLGGAIGIAFALILPPRYVAQARLVVESEQIPDDLAASTVRTEATEQLQIIQQRILTRNNLLEMANRLGIYRTPAARAGRTLRPDEMVSDLRNRIRINTTGGRRGQADATLVNVSFTAERADLAASVANEVVTLILRENVAMRTGVSGQTLEFFEQEVQRLDEELARRGAQIAAFQESNREALPDSLDFRRSQMASAQERLLQIQRDEAALKDRRENLTALYEATGRIGSISDDALSAEARELRRLREQYATSAAVLSPQNPRMKVMQAQIDTLERIVTEQAAEASAVSGLRGADGMPLSPYDIQLADLDSQLDFLAERRAQIEAEMEKLQATIDATPKNAISLQTLQRDYANIRTQYDQAVANKARAETGDMIEALSKGQRITVIEQATAPEEPNSPNRPKLVAAGFGGGMLAGLALIALLELTNRSVRRPVDIVSGLDIAPLATLSFIRTRREILRRRALIAAAFGVVAIGIPAGLWAVNAYVMPLDIVVEKVMRQLPAGLAIPGIGRSA
ncbi:lipopolysaccharide biosynthesis [Oceaniovalibus guishaninsula JLT2003]|uniref:Lipopolysaccharide biosynthesis n=1 Tax=Oceaniovalibus guishaninsula JLT2003 TaxID=1231392 RepID=K2I345_9RHOB|nr:Wzz/FepE/Etk N-terminal domain-containing protein [Oceaniovalibus guishaninsula]EKE43305.1 lipopolysaccharide biosynthesis [Oceaniovalibus guishaninsula JLT2003]